MDVICPLCQSMMSSKGIYMHVRAHHLDELKEQGWRKIKNQTRKIPKPITIEEEPKKRDTSKDKEYEAWTEETQKAIGFYPSASALAIMNRFTTTTDPSKFINEAIINEGKKRGLMAALIKTEGGESIELMGQSDTDKEFQRFIQLLTAQAQVNQSFNQNSPMVMMIEMLKKKVNNGMGMGQFGKEFMGMIMMMKLMEGM